MGPRLQALLDRVPRGEQRTVDMLVALNRLVQSRVAYIVRMEPGVWTPEETLAEGKGSCRDSAWLLVQLLRHLGYAARFVSGYLIQLVGDVKPLEGPEGPTADFTDLHAWAEVYLPGAGWVGMDATSGLLTGEGHIPLAATPDPQSAAAITGAVETCETEFGFDMRLMRLRETPRVTKPYTEAQWQDILALGAAVDRALTAGNVRLTMGGEPTFVAAGDFDAPEWNTDALGPTKQHLAAKLMQRLRELWSPGSALQNVSGKHYPGEQLPRWALLRIGARTANRCGAIPPCSRRRTTSIPQAAADAQRFCAALAERLQVDPSLINQAYEDVHYYLWREHRLPTMSWSKDAKLADPMERARLARVFGQGLGASVGSVLPLRRTIRDGVRVWQSAKWSFRGGALFLLPGDLPIGYRLPLDSLPWEDPDALEHDIETDPFAPHPPLPPRQAFDHAASPMGANAEAFRPVAQELAGCGGRGRSGAHRTLRRAARRDCPRVLPAALRGRGLADPGRRGRKHRRGNRTQGGPGGLSAAARSRSAAFLGHARPRRDRGECASRRQTGRADRAAHRGAV